MERTIKHWNKLPADMVGSPSLEVFQMVLDKVLDNLLDAAFPQKDFPTCSILWSYDSLDISDLSKFKKRRTISIALGDLVKRHKDEKSICITLEGFWLISTTGFQTSFQYLNIQPCQRQAQERGFLTKDCSNEHCYQMGVWSLSPARGFFIHTPSWWC